MIPTKQIISKTQKKKRKHNSFFPNELQKSIKCSEPLHVMQIVDVMIDNRERSEERQVGFEQS